ncbi:MAG: cupin domain-containing protein [Thermoguttaceae bacterium]
MAVYTKYHVSQDQPRVELHENLSLTGAEVSVNALPAGGSVPFVHAHKQNEEIYCVTSGRGKAIIDGETIELAAGDWLRIAPEGRRQFFAAEDEGLSYICIQVKANSLEGYTMTDGIVC